MRRVRFHILIAQNKHCGLISCGLSVFVRQTRMGYGLIHGSILLHFIPFIYIVIDLWPIALFSKMRESSHIYLSPREILIFLSIRWSKKFSYVLIVFLSSVMVRTGSVETTWITLVLTEVMKFVKNHLLCIRI